MVHYGTIASGNQLIKNGVIRDQISEELGGILCYEMEAAGVMNTLRCLVIRGICDYSDSHKNKDWQPYASLTAAAYAKELLSFVPPIRLQEAPLPSEPMGKTVLGRSLRASKKQSTMKKWQPPHGELSERRFTTQHISNYDAFRVHSALTRLRCPETTRWILDDENYQTWRRQDGTTLWLTGKIGCGKTLIASTIAEHLLDTTEDKELVLHFFYRHSHKTDLTAFSLLNSCIKQTLDHFESIGRHLSQDLYTLLENQYSGRKLSYDFIEVIHEIFEPLLSLISKTTLVIDGLDECGNNEIPRVLGFVRMFVKKPGRNVLISGRESLDIAHSIPGSLKIQASENTTDDISVYIRWKIEEKMLDRRIIEDPAVRDEIETILSNKAEQMILWVSLQIENIWTDCANDSDIRKALKDLPKDLTETYDRCLHRIFTRDGIFANGYAFKALLWILEAAHPLSLTQLRQALAIDPMDGTLDYDKVPSVQDTVRSCANLVVQDIEGHILLAHHSVDQYLNDHERLGELRSTLRSSESPGTPLTGLAMLCVSHLTSAHYSLAVQPILKGSTLRLEAPAVSRITGGVPWYIKPFLPQPRPVQIKLPPRKPERANIAELPEFFHFAREQWPELTQNLMAASLDWIFSDLELEKFLNLVLQPNLTWRLHPWEPLGQSLDSHYFALLGWAIVNRHKPMLQALFRHAKLRIDLYVTPFQQYGGLNAIFLAARSNEPWILEMIRRQLDDHNSDNSIWDRDSRNWTVLHHAIDSKSTRLVAKLAHRNGPGQFADGVHVPDPLELAATKGYGDIVRILLQVPSFNYLESRILATKAAIRHGHHLLLVEQLSIPKLSSSIIDNTGETVINFGADIGKAFVEAARVGHTSVIDHLLQTVPQYRSLWIRSILFAAIQAKQGPVVARVLADQENLPQDLLIESIILAGQQADPSTLGQIIDQLSLESISKKDLNRQDRKACMSEVGAAMIYSAVKGDHVQLVKILLDRGINADSLYNNIPPLREAVRQENEEIVSLLLEHKAFIFPEYLRLAIEKNCLKVAKLLLENGASPGVFSALHHAAAVGSSAMLELLLLYTSDRSISADGLQRTPLMHAARSGNLKNVELLCDQPGSVELKETNDIDLLDALGWTALFHSCTTGHIHCARALLSYGANPKVLDLRGQTILHAVAESLRGPASISESEFMSELIDAGYIDVNMQDHSGRTALHIAASMSDWELIYFLLQRGADINVKESVKGQTPLHIAASLGSPHRLILLLHETSVDVNLQDNEGDTALHIAVKEGKFDAAGSLMAAGASFLIKNNAGNYPLDLAQSDPRNNRVLLSRLGVENRKNSKARSKVSEEAASLSRER